MIIGVGAARKFGSSVVSRFKDGELYVKVPKLKSVTVVSAFPPPADNLLELLFVLDALKRQNADVHLIITYFGYARQDRVNVPGEACSAEVIARALKPYANKITIIDCHSERLKKFLSYSNVVPIKPFLPFVPKGNLVIVAPDKGAVSRARAWQKFVGGSVVFLEKTRPSHDVSEIVTITGDVKGKNVLIVDDMISTGGTICNAAELVKQKGARDIFVAATHGVFSGDALKRLSKAPVKKVFVTDSLPQQKHKLLKVVSIKGILRSISQEGF